MGKGHKPNESQRAFNQSGTWGMNKQALNRARQIATQRAFTYDRVGPICISCGGPRETRAGLRCELCTVEEEAA